MHRFSRRRFLELGLKSMAGAGLALGNDASLTLAQAASTSVDPDDYRALVCVYLDGGMDGFSLMVPTGSGEYNAYAQSRAGLAVPANTLLALQGQASNTPAVGLHPAANALQPLYEEGRLAMIANIGNLIEPVSRESIENGLATLPEQLFSHSDQTRQWQQLQGRGNATTGWGALASHQLDQFHERDYLTSISLSGANYWQSSHERRPYSIKSSGLVEYAGLDADNDWQAPRRAAFERVLKQPRSHLLTRNYADIHQRALQITAELGEALASRAGQLTESPPETELGQSLAMVARLIAARDRLGLRRQIYYVSMGGFDVHDNQNLELPLRFGELADALAYFQRSLDSLGEAGNVVTFTASDFGRALSSNGDGTDHGWGNHLMAMGEPVRGGEVHGTIPQLDIDGPDSVHHGRVVPTLAASQYAATLLGWLGLDAAQIDDVLPGLDRFSARTLDIMA